MSKDIDFRINSGSKHVCTVTYHDNNVLYDYLSKRGSATLETEALQDMTTREFGTSLVHRKLVPVLLKYIKNGYSVTVSFV